METAPGKDYYPPVNVTWYGAHEYCNFYRDKGYRLPSEAEWEYVARQIGRNIRFGNGDSLADAHKINFNPLAEHRFDSENYTIEGKYLGTTSRVCKYLPNKLGIYDLSGNVWEWCQDWYERNSYFS